MPFLFRATPRHGNRQEVSSLGSQPEGGRAFSRPTRRHPRRYENNATTCTRSSIRAIWAPHSKALDSGGPHTVDAYAADDDRDLARIRKICLRFPGCDEGELEAPTRRVVEAQPGRACDPRAHARRAVGGTNAVRPRGRTRGPRGFARPGARARAPERRARRRQLHRHDQAGRGSAHREARAPGRAFDRLDHGVDRRRRGRDLDRATRSEQARGLRRNCRGALPTSRATQP